MGFSNKKQYIFSALFVLCCTVLSAVILYIGTKVIPSAITYTASTSENSKIPVGDTYSRISECTYENIYSIAENGPFSINAAGDDIYIYSESTCLYRIKANLSEFPASDKDIILSGIEIADKASLYEIVEYMES